MTAAGPPATRMRRRAPAPAAAPGQAGETPLMFGLFSSTDELIDTVLGASALLGQLLAFGFGARGALLFLGCSALLAVRGVKASVGGVFRAWPVLLLPLLALASTLWSNHPDVTLRAAVELVLTALAGVIIANRINARQFVAALWAATFLASLVCIPTLSRGGDGGLVSMMGSKNQLSFLVGTMAMAAVSIILDRQHWKLLRFAAVASMPLAIGLTIGARSAGGAVGTVVGCGLIVLVSMTLRARLSTRAYLLAALIILGSPIVAMGPVIEEAANDFIVDVLHKDPTLTGRTYLWEKAVSISASRPMLGVGFNAFWVQGDADPEGLWALYGMINRAGFNFHNQYLDTRVELGWAGLTVLVIAIIYVVLGVGLETLFAPTLAHACLLANVAVNLIRSFTETGLVAEFNIYTVIIFAAGIYGWNAVRGRNMLAPAGGEATPGHGDALRPRAEVVRRRRTPTRAIRRGSVQD